MQKPNGLAFFTERCIPNGIRFGSKNHYADRRATSVATITRYIEAQYPDYKNKIAQTMTKELTQNILTKTKELQQWIKLKI